jgi:hypothetical protein
VRGFAKAEAQGSAASGNRDSCVRVRAASITSSCTARPPNSTLELAAPSFGPPLKRLGRPTRKSASRRVQVAPSFVGPQSLHAPCRATSSRDTGAAVQREALGRRVRHTREQAFRSVAVVSAAARPSPYNSGVNASRREAA